MEALQLFPSAIKQKTAIGQDAVDVREQDADRLGLLVIVHVPGCSSRQTVKKTKIADERSDVRFPAE
jgi:hypothetical protein